MNFLLVEKKGKKMRECFIRRKRKEKLNEKFIIQKMRWPISKSMQAFLATVPPLYHVNGKRVPTGESWQCTTKTGDTYEKVNPKHYGKPELFSMSF